MSMETYASEFEDFSAANLSQLDSWVFNRVESFFDRAKDSQPLQLALRQDGLVFFLHLLGCDTNGHRNKPHSTEYMDNIAVVDDGVRRVTEMFDRYWSNDGRTAFVFTADHGMTDWGSHGAGMDHETMTPFVAWGAGVRTPIAGKEEEDHRQWESFNGAKRSDVKQVDIAPLMSSLLGIGVPRHSAGRLPIDYLSIHDSHKVEASLAVARQTNEQLRVARDSFKRIPLARWLHREYKDLTEKDYLALEDKIKTHVRVNKYGLALQLTEDLFDRATGGVEYYRKYYRAPLFLAVSLSYAGFIVLLTLKIIKNFTYLGTTRVVPWLWSLPLTFLTLGLMALVLAFVLLGQSAPMHHILYYLAPIVLWYLALRDLLSLDLSVSSGIISAMGGFKRVFVLLVFTVSILECLVAAFFDRRALSGAVALVAVLQAWRMCKHAPLDTLMWLVLNAMLAAFSFQPMIGRDSGSSETVLAAGGLSALVALVTIISLRQKAGDSKMVIMLLLCFMPLSGACVWLSQTGQNNYIIQGVAWVIFVSGLPLGILMSSWRLFPRLLCICMALEASYILLSLSYEGLFLLVLALTLLIWLRVEHAESFRHRELPDLDLAADALRQRNVVDARDVFRALFFLHFSVVSFFGTGNIASLNSFDPTSIACLVSVFNPFLMGGLLLGKVLIPFLLVALFVVAVTRVARMHSRALFLLLLLFSDVMSLHFFFSVTDKGSWLEIGTSLSHFVIAEATAIFLLLFYALAGWMLTVRGKKGAKEIEEHDDKERTFTAKEEAKIVYGKLG